MAGEISRDSRADAEPDRDDTLRCAHLLQVIKDQKRIRKQRLCAGPAAARSIAAVVECNDVTIRKEAVQVQDHGFGIPGVSAEPQQRRPMLSLLSYAWYSQAHELVPVRYPNL